MLWQRILCVLRLITEKLLSRCFGYLPLRWKFPSSSTATWADRLAKPHSGRCHSRHVVQATCFCCQGLVPPTASPRKSVEQICCVCGLGIPPPLPVESDVWEKFDHCMIAESKKHVEKTSKVKYVIYLWLSHETLFQEAPRPPFFSVVVCAFAVSLQFVGLWRESLWICLSFLACAH